VKQERTATIQTIMLHTDETAMQPSTNSQWRFKSPRAKLKEQHATLRGATNSTDHNSAAESQPTSL